MLEEYTLYAFNSFKFIRFIIWPVIWFILVYFPWALETEYIILLLYGVLYKCHLDPVV